MSKPETVTCASPSSSGWKSYQTVLPKLVPAHWVFSGPAPPSGAPVELGLNRSAWVVASVVSTVSVDSVRSAEPGWFSDVEAR